ncbi:TRAP transporter small permease [uncultured Propionivibrio sp.]|uniref:TRAP transporter small permease n=1 Tax=uncultured Propionivibrio sp. TaxID=426737 RepID=UPI0029BFB7BD|nr:TRAP transporter small permease [uncultured Propionivibrio sp.]
MNRLIDTYFRALKFLVVFMISAMVALIFGNVVLRYGFNSGISVSEELSRWAFVWLTYTGAIIAIRENTHLGMDTLISRLPMSGKRFCYVLSHLLMLFCVALFGIGSWKQAAINLHAEASASGLSIGLFFYGAGVFFSLPAMLILLKNLWLVLSGGLNDSDLICIKESEEDLDENAIAELQQEMERETVRLSTEDKAKKD